MKPIHKNLLSITLLLSMLFSLIACGSPSPTADLTETAATTTDTNPTVQNLVNPMEEESFYYEASPYTELDDALKDASYMVRSTGNYADGSYIYLFFFDETLLQEPHLLLLSPTGELKANLSLRDALGEAGENIVGVVTDSKNTIQILTSSMKAENNQDGTYRVYSINTDGTIAESFISIEKEPTGNRTLLRYANWTMDNTDKMYIFGAVEAGTDYYKVVDVFDAEGNFLYSVSEDFKNPQTASQFSGVLCKDNTDVYLGLQAGGQGALQFCLLDNESQELNDKQKLFSTEEVIFQQHGWTYYFNTDGANVFSADYSETKTLFLWQDFSMAPNQTAQLVVLSSDEMILGTTGATAQSLEWKMLTKVKGEKPEPPEKKVLQVGGIFLESDEVFLKAKEIFEREYPDYRVEPINYEWSWEDYATLDKSKQQINMQILSGDAPDILFGNMVFDFTLYAERGLLTDLSVFIEEDESFDPVDYVDFLFSIKNTNDEIYILFSGYDIPGIKTKIKTFHELKSWTVQDFIDITEKYAEQKKPFDDYPAYALLRYFICDSVSTIANLSDPEMYSTTGELASALTLSKKYHFDNDDYGWRDWDALLNDRILFSPGSLGRASYWACEWANSGGDITFLPYPTFTDNDEKLMHFSPNESFGILKDSKEQEAAWNFIKVLLGEELQNYYGTKLMDTLPVLSSALEVSLLEEAMNSTRYKISPRGVQEVRNILKRTVYPYIPNYVVEGIIVEESGAYFAGQKTLEQTLKVIQERMTTYLNSQ